MVSEAIDWAEVAENLTSEPRVVIMREKLLRILKTNSRQAAMPKLTYSQFTMWIRKNPRWGEYTQLLFAKTMPVSLYDYYVTPKLPDLEDIQPRITIPVRSYQCTHVDVFDFDYFVRQVNERSPECPICNKAVDVSSLYIDQQIQSIISRGEAEARSNPDSKPLVVLFPVDSLASSFKKGLLWYTKEEILRQQLGTMGHNSTMVSRKPASTSSQRLE
jgi:hypothetical protein